MEHWDAALSSGHYVTILSDDDAHDIFNPDEVGHFCTFINVPELNQKNIISSLKSGNAFGAEIYREIGDSYQTKKEKLNEIAKLQSVTLIGDTIQVNVDQIASEIKFIGLDGQVRKGTEVNNISANYIFKDDDSYIRIEIFFPNGNKFYLNPFIRYNDEIDLPKIKGIKWADTWIFRIFAFLIFALLSYLVIRIARSIHFRIHS